MCLFFHKWSKWEQYEHETYRDYQFQGKHIGALRVDMQKRQCDRCGKIQSIDL